MEQARCEEKGGRMLEALWSLQTKIGPETSIGRLVLEGGTLAGCDNKRAFLGSYHPDINGTHLLISVVIVQGNEVSKDRSAITAGARTAVELRGIGHCKAMTWTGRTVGTDQIAIEFQLSR